MQRQTFRGQGKRKLAEIMLQEVRYPQLHTEACSQYPMAYDNSIHLTCHTHVAGVNKIQVRYSQSPDSTNKGLCKQDT